MLTPCIAGMKEGMEGLPTTQPLLVFESWSAFSEAVLGGRKNNRPALFSANNKNVDFEILVARVSEDAPTQGTRHSLVLLLGT